MSRFSVIRWLYQVAWREQRRVVAAYAVLLAGDVLATGGFGLALRAVIQASLHDAPRGAVAASAVAAVCWGVTAIGSSARTNMLMLLAEAVGVRLDERILRMVGRLEDLRQLDDPGYADRVALLRGGGDLLAQYALRALDTIAIALRLAVVLTLLAVVAPAMVALAGALVPVLWFQRRGQRRVGRSVLASGSDVRLAEHLHTLLTEPGSGMEIRVAGAGAALRGKADDTWARLIRRQERARYAAASLVAAGWVVFMAAYCGALLVTVDSVAADRTAPGDVLLVITITVSLRAQAESAMATLRRNADGTHYLDAFLWLEGVSAAAEPVGPTGAVPDRLADGITLRGVRFDYPGTGTPVLRDIDLDLAAGTTVAVVGEHGAGKTTLIRLLSGLYTPTSGSITVDGTALPSLARRDWWSRTTANFQDYARFAFVAREAVGVGDLAALDDRERIERAVVQGDARSVVDGLPSGLETRLGGQFDGAELSGGQWQRVALSRAFMRTRPLLFVLDEPTASLDARSEYDLYRRQMETAARMGAEWGTVTVVISHRFSTVRMADRIVVLADGRVTEQGSHDDLMALNGTYAELYRLQADGYRPAGAPAPAPVPSGTSPEEA
ncbi:ABC transporter ATP-binding protein [Actinacidiphila yeochonensis]|uniref:ABC transporter ATP-binding protein n=1 Tax=Actinacidiphila yeochonensis TaxID=89050 RepID=UPI0006898040|nr:ABC transporter ATP-binding protein [Actinacidiphila yeochonensis]